MNKETLELIKEHKNLIYKVASKFYSLEPEDLFQAGVMGLIKAKRNYKSNQNAKFSTYAYEYIFGEMYALSMASKEIKVNKETLRLCKKIEEARNYLAQKINRVPDNFELAAFLEISMEDIVTAEYATMSMLSLDDAFDEEKESSLHEVIADKQDNIDDKLILFESIEKLNKDEQKVIDYRYFKDFTQSETAKVLCMSQAKVSRYEKNSLDKMRNYIAC